MQQLFLTQSVATTIYICLQFYWITTEKTFQFLQADFKTKVNILFIFFINGFCLIFFPSLDYYFLFPQILIRHIFEWNLSAHFNCRKQMVLKIYLCDNLWVYTLVFVTTWMRSKQTNSEIILSNFAYTQNNKSFHYSEQREEKMCFAKDCTRWENVQH